MASALPLVVLLLCDLAASSTVVREVIKFDYAWRLRRGHAGDRAPPPVTRCNAQSFPLNLSGLLCIGLAHSNKSIHSATECRALCCDSPGCNAWQLSHEADWSQGCHYGYAWLDQQVTRLHAHTHHARTHNVHTATRTSH